MKILGDGPEKKNLENKIKKYDLRKKIKLIGFKRDTKKYYKEANLFINASLFEGFPNAVVEAISYGIPVICADCRGGMKEIILNGRGGDFFEVNNAEQLAQKIISFYKDPKKLNQKLFIARENIKKYSILNHVKKYEDIFKKI